LCILFIKLGNYKINAYLEPSPSLLSDTWFLSFVILAILRES
jgi:hypothetical protein